MAGPLKQSLEWLRTDGARMADQDWDQFWIKSLGLYLNGKAPEIRDQMGHYIPDDDFLILFNAHSEGVSFNLPSDLPQKWTLVFDTSTGPPPNGEEEPVVFPLILSSHSLALLRHGA